MKTIGILGCGFDCEENIDQVLKPWIELKDKNLYGYKFIFSFVHGQFKEYLDINGEQPIKVPSWYEKHKRSIDYFFTPPPLTEAENRNVALKPLLDSGCDYILLLDLQDEVFTIQQIENILEYVELEKFITWFSLSYKNYVFDVNTYLKQPFTPPRIFRVNSQGYKLDSFYWDNDIIYSGFTAYGIIKTNYKELPSKTIPTKIAYISHFTWLNNIKSKLKVEYQMKHFGHCGYKWNYTENKLEFNEEFYKKIGQQIPEVIKE